MKLHWFVPSLIGFFCVMTPAKAGQLTTWQYDSTQNQLAFTTDEDVQPRAQLVFEPTRLVIDLPGTSVGEVPTGQIVGRGIQQVRIGQFDAQTTRIVIELQPGYILDPQQIHFRGLSATQWIVQLPLPQFTAAASPASLPSANTASSVTATSSDSVTGAGTHSPGVRSTTQSTTQSTIRSRPQATATQSATQPSATRSTTTQSITTQSPPQSATQSEPRSTARSAARSDNASPIAQINTLQVTAEGLLVSSQGTTPKVSIERSRGGRSVTIQLENAQLSRQFRDRERQVDRHGIDDLTVEQDSDNVVAIKLDVARRSPDWQSQIGNRGEILLLPETATPNEAVKTADPHPPAPVPLGRSIVSPPITVAEQPSVARPTGAADTVPRVQLAAVQGIDLDLSHNQLLIQTDRPVAHQAQWQSGLYTITLSPARLASRVSGPQLSSSDPLRHVRLRQADDQTVVITVQPAAGVQFGVLNLITPQLLALELQRATATAQTTPNSTRPLPNVIPNGRLLVVIDPGHGGADVGAVGIGDIHEADIVLAISQQVATLLQQQGIQTLLTRNTDVEIDLEPRVQMAEQANATLFVSIHANSMGMDRPDINGAETYYYSSGEALAEVIQNSVVNGSGLQDRGVRQARFYVLKKTSMPAVLVETGFVTGSEDAPRLANPRFQTQMAKAIAQGILQYLQQQAVAGNQ